jgi:hypothetical protein
MKAFMIPIKKNQDHLLLTFDEWMDEIDALEASDSLRNRKLAYSTKHYVNDLVDGLYDLSEQHSHAMRGCADSAKNIPPELREQLIKTMFPNSHEEVLESIEEYEQETSE